VKCLISVRYNGVEYFCSGGDDLCLWNKKGELLQQLHPINDDSDIHTLVFVKHERIIAATVNSSSLDIYQLIMKGHSPNLEPYSKKPTSHREAIRCLVPISEAMFASGSLDGVIFFWSSHTFTVTKHFNEHEKYRDQSTKAYQYAVNQLVTSGDLVLAAIGNGFQVYNRSEPEATACIAALPHAHSAPVNSIAYNHCKGAVITCSQDASIRLWELDIPSPSRLSPRKLSMLQRNKRPPLIGELKGHDGAVMYAFDFGIDGFASCGSDNIILLWKDGTREIRKQIDIVRNKKQKDCEALTASVIKKFCSTNTT
jgi:WD40 repeat protein